MAALPPTIQTAFDGWVDLDTWHSNHALDEARFHRFVWSVVQHPTAVSPSEEDIKQLIKDKWKGRLESEYLDKKAQDASSLYVNLLDFGRAQPD